MTISAGPSAGPFDHQIADVAPTDGENLTPNSIANSRKLSLNVRRCGLQRARLPEVPFAEQVPLCMTEACTCQEATWGHLREVNTRV